MSKQPIVILHGWQSKLSRWQPLIKILQKHFTVYFPSLPGFKEKLTRPWELKDYVNWLKSYLSAKKIKNPILLGHSFGGRIAIKFINQGSKVQRLILIASAGLEPKNNFKKTIFLILAKFGKLFFLIPPLSFLKKFARWLLYTLAREKDYYRADKFLRSTMREILAEDLRPLLEKIRIPTLILWGKRDKITPVAEARIFDKEIRDSRLVIFGNGNHGLPFKLSKKVAVQIISFCR